MKRFYLPLLVLLAGSFAFGFVSCSDDNDDDAKLTVNPTSISDFTAEGGTQTFTVTITPEDVKWTAKAERNWASVDISGNTFTVTVVANNTTAERENSVIVSAPGAKSVKMSFKQAAGTEGPDPIESLTASPDDLEYTDAGGDKTITITSNVDWTVSVTYNEGADWLSFSDDSGNGNATVTATATANTATTERSATIKIAAVGNATLKKSIDVTQAGAVATGPISIDGLVGTWTVSGYLLNYDGPSSQWQVAVDDRQLEITKKNATTIEINGIFGYGTPYHDTVEATVDETGSTVSIPAQALYGGTDSADPDGWPLRFVYYDRAISASYSEIWDVNAEDIAVTGSAGSYKIDLTTDNYFGDLQDGTKVYTSMVALTKDPAGVDPTVYYLSPVYANIVLTQGATRAAGTNFVNAGFVPAKTAMAPMYKARYIR